MFRYVYAYRLYLHVQCMCVGSLKRPKHTLHVFTLACSTMLGGLITPVVCPMSG